MFKYRLYTLFYTTNLLATQLFFSQELIPNFYNVLPQRGTDILEEIISILSGFCLTLLSQGNYCGILSINPNFI
ncbi:MAG TPA: hypothetical protein P5028_00255 [Candidatus Marinimicrobia bacterium]|nr:hypothetical protein [Candidatus Neomarinimicrobiota bacterium]